jgi:hypothetical protein
MSCMAEGRSNPGAVRGHREAGSDRSHLGAVERAAEAVVHAAESVAYPAIVACLRSQCTVPADAGGSHENVLRDIEFKAHAITLRIVALLLIESRPNVAASIGGDALNALNQVRAGARALPTATKSLFRALSLDRGWFHVTGDGSEAADELRGCGAGRGGDLQDCSIVLDDRDLAAVIHALMHARLEASGSAPIDYAEVDPGVLGRLHERWLSRAQGRHETRSRRARQGAFYTPRNLISHVLDQTIDPLLRDRDHAITCDPLLRVVDPAVGSGEFLRAAVNRLAERWQESRTFLGSAVLAKAASELRSRAKLPEQFNIDESDAQMRAPSMLRAIAATRCVYGVDVDPLAVQIARFTLWIDAARNGEQLPEIAAHIRHGNALLGDGHLAVSGTQGKPASEATALAFYWQREFAGIFKQASEQVDAASVADNGHRGQHGGPGFDATIGNPPFVDSESMSKDDPLQRALIASRYCTARGNWDLYVPFVELAMNITRRGGRFALVTPSRIVAADYTMAIQERLLKLAINDCTDFAATTHFESASIAVAVLAATQAPAEDDHLATFTRRDVDGRTVSASAVSLGALRALPAGSIGAALWARNEKELRDTAQCTKLGSIAVLNDGATTAEAYRIVERLISEDELVGDARGHETVANARSTTGAPCSQAERPGMMHGHVRLVNTGTIDPYRMRWDQRPTRYLGRVIFKPVIAEQDLAAISARRLLQARSAKVVVAGLAGSIEAAVAPPGWLCGKSAIAVIPHESVCPYALCAVLNSARALIIYRMFFGHRGFSSRSLAIGPRQLERLAVPDASLLTPASALHGPCDLALEMQGQFAHDGVASLTHERAAALLASQPVLSYLGRLATQAAELAGGTDPVEFTRIRSLIDRFVDVAYSMSPGKG